MAILELFLTMIVYDIYFWTFGQKKQYSIQYYMATTAGMVTVCDVYTSIADLTDFLLLDFFSATQSKKKQNKKLLPHMCLYFAWILCALTILTCSAILILYGMAFGNRTSWLWLLTIILSLIKDIFLMQPLKIFVMSLVMSLVFKRINSQDENDILRKYKKNLIEEVLSENIANDDNAVSPNDNTNSAESIEVNNSNSLDKLVVIEL